MALTPPNNNKGDFNTSPSGPVVWDQVQPTNNLTIDRNDMPFASTVEYKGYYKAEATGDHAFTLSGSTGITGYGWISSAPRSSDHIKTGGNTAVETTLNKSYGVIIPNKPSGANYWPFEDQNLLGTNFIGYGYWPKSGYGDSGGWNGIYGPGKTATPGTDCGFSQTAHLYFLPGDIRTYGSDTQYLNRNAGPGWQGPEDPHFGSACYPASQPRPLKRICRNNDTTPCDQDATPNTPGRSSQVFLDRNFKAEGSADDRWAIYEKVNVSGAGADDFYIWPKAVSVTRTRNGKTAPERVNVRFGVKMRLATQEYTFEWKSRDGLKMWYKVGGGDAREFGKFPDDEGGNNPCNATASGSSSAWLPGRGETGFTGKVTVPEDGFIQFIGHAAGVPGSNTHGWSLVIRDADGNKVWNTQELLTGSEDGLIGIDECGFNALLDDNARIADNKSTEFYTLDGWLGYSPGNVFTADESQGDNTERDASTTRQYLWSNALVKTRGGTSIGGTVKLRQGDYYFIRVIVSNHLNQPANYQFKVVPPTGGISQSVRFSGNGDASSDTSVGGNAGGNGIPINKDLLCSSVLAPNGVAINNSDVNFAYIPSLRVVLNLNQLDVDDFEIGREGQAESVTLPSGEVVGSPASKVISFTDGGFNENITLSQLVRGGTDGIPPLTDEQKGAIRATQRAQVEQNQVLTYNSFRSAITSQAVISWGSNSVGNTGGGNYPFIYHAVSNVINSICSGVDIETPVRPNSIQAAGSGFSGANSGANTNQSDGLCIDVDFNILSFNGVQITSECKDTCKTPNTFARPESQYKKVASEYVGADSRYFNKIRVQNNYGVVAPSIWSTPGASQYGSYDISRLSAVYDSAKFNPGEVTSIPVFVPEVFVPDGFDNVGNTGTGQGFYECAYKFELSSNTFLYDPDNFGDATEGGILRPYLVWWVSSLPGGPALGKYKITRPSYSTTPKFYATMSYEQFAADLNREPSKRVFDGYLGNTYGARWWNLAPLKYEEVQALNFDIPKAGTTPFVDLLSVKGYQTNQIRIQGTVTSPDCTSLASSSRNRLGGSGDSSFKSAPDMIPYIGE